VDARGTLTAGGTLAGVRVLEIGGIGPAPFAGMMLADHGADVLRIDRGSPAVDALVGTCNPTLRGRPAVGLDLKHPAGREAVLALCERADAVVEGFRPGVMERLGLGPDVVLERAPRIVYARMTGYGQDGPLREVAGHDINYIAVAGVLGASARAGERPHFALNLVGDYGGGAMLLAFGIVCGVLEARSSGRGQVIDAAMVDGAALLTTLLHGMRAGGRWADDPGTNLLDSGAHFYEVYETSDGGHVAVGAIEPQFYERLLAALGLSADDAPQWDRARWPELKQRFARVFRTRSRAEWTALLEHDDACATAVVAPSEAPAHPHLAARATFVEIDGVAQPQAAPRFSRTPGAARPAGDDEDAALASWGLGSEQRRALRDGGALCVRGRRSR
jgi:alpha-methylacyl-CoA racemase